MTLQLVTDEASPISTTVTIDPTQDPRIVVASRAAALKLIDLFAAQMDECLPAVLPDSRSYQLAQEQVKACLPPMGMDLTISKYGDRVFGGVPIPQCRMVLGLGCEHPVGVEAWRGERRDMFETNKSAMAGICKAFVEALRIRVSEFSHA